MLQEHGVNDVRKRLPSRKCEMLQRDRDRGLLAAGGSATGLGRNGFVGGEDADILPDLGAFSLPEPAASWQWTDGEGWHEQRDG
jgi:hypothetical protein